MILIDQINEAINNFKTFDVSYINKLGSYSFNLFSFLLLQKGIIDNFLDKQKLKDYIELTFKNKIDALNFIDDLNNLYIYIENINSEFHYFYSVLSDANLFIKTFKNFTSDKTINNDSQGARHSALYHVFMTFTIPELLNALKSNGFYIRLPRLDANKDYGELYDSEDSKKIEEIKRVLFDIFVGDKPSKFEYNVSSGLNIQIKFLNDSMIKLIDMAKSLHRNKFAGSSTDINNELLNLYKDMSGKVRIIYDLLPNYEQFKKC